MACNALWIALSIGIVGLISVIIGVVGSYLVPNVVRVKISETLPLKPGSEARDRWENPPVPIYFRLYVFHVNNPDEILEGELPEVTEYGPYVYRERRIKNIIDEDKNTIVYQQKLIFEFDKQASGNLSDEDVYTVVNVQALALSQVVYNLKIINPAIRLVNTAIPKMWPTGTSNPLFMKVKVKDLFFGRLPMYCNQSTSLENVDTKILCEAVKLYKPKTIELNGLGNNVNSFSMFRYKNDSYDGVYEIDKGVDDVTGIGIIKKWNNLTLLNDWKAESCNKISGTDSSIFRPYLDLDDIHSLNIFNTDACRSIQLTREGTTEYKGVPGIRFTTDENTFGSVLKNPDNYCYCPQSIIGTTHHGGCLKSGVLELDSCHRVPILISHPHFLMADPSYQVIKGLNPDKEKHQAFVNLEPYTGYPLSAASRIQINIFLQSIHEIVMMKKLPNVILPIAWMEETIELTDDLITQIDRELLTNLLIVDVVRWLFVGVGSTMVLSSLSYYMVKIRSGGRIDVRPRE